MVAPITQAELYQFLAPLISSKGSGKKTERFKGYGPEDKICMEFVQFIVGASLEGKLKALWFHPANEVSSGTNYMYGQYLKKLGKMKGIPDFVFGSGKGMAFIEMKSPKGKMTPEQEFIQRWAFSVGIPYCLARSVDEAKNALYQWGILTV
jgi:hypothetical protein